MKKSDDAVVLRKKQHLMRQALNLASALPDDLEDARLVLKYMGDIYRGYLSDKQSPPCQKNPDDEPIRLVPT